MEGWEKRWHDKATEPYTILHIEQRWPDSQWPKDREWWFVFYRAYSKRSYIMVRARDELGAYMEGLKRIEINKRKTDQLNKRKKGANHG
jgi:hypothetical protein